MGNLLKKVILHSCVVTFIFSSSFGHSANEKKSVLDVINSDSRFSIFGQMVERAGVEHLFNGKIKINATIYVPTNEAFATLPQSMSEALELEENRGPLIKLIKSHYFIGTSRDMSEGDYLMTTNINGDKIRIEQAQQLYVKDMIIQNEPIYVAESKIVPIECVMYVQPSLSDHRLSVEQQEEFAITSCCLRTLKEVKAFVQSTVMQAAEGFE